MGEEQQLPEYVCHKRVRAAKILGFAQLDPPDRAGVTVLLEGGATRVVSYDWMLKHRLSEQGSGGYFVEYGDGYTSWSPSKAFEEGYRLIGKMGTDETDNHGQRAG